MSSGGKSVQVTVSTPEGDKLASWTTHEDGRHEQTGRQVIGGKLDPSPVTHVIKCDPPAFSDLLIGDKRCEIRKDDRGYKRGDALVICEFDRETQTYSGRELAAVVLHIQRGYGLMDGYVAMTLTLHLGIPRG